MLKDNIRGDLGDMILLQGTRPHTRVQRPEQHNQRLLRHLREGEKTLNGRWPLHCYTLLGLIAASCLHPQPVLGVTLCPCLLDTNVNYTSSIFQLLVVPLLLHLNQFLCHLFIFASTLLARVHVKLCESQSQPLTQVSYPDSLEIVHVPQRGTTLTAA